MRYVGKDDEEVFLPPYSTFHVINKAMTVPRVISAVDTDGEDVARDAEVESQD